jgi:1-phosphatidylinositol-3-phosphate 5-kinase
VASGTRKHVDIQEQRGEWLSIKGGVFWSYQAGQAGRRHHHHDNLSDGETNTPHGQSHLFCSQKDALCPLGISPSFAALFQHHTATFLNLGPPALIGPIEMPSQKSDSPTASFTHNSRRGSTVSQQPHTIATSSQDSAAQTLEKIHTAASRSDTLTTFDFGSPPRPPSSGDIKGLAGDIVQGGLSGLYSRLRATVGGAKDAVPSPTTHDGGEDVFAAPATKQKLAISNTTGMISPINTSAPSSRLQSPSVATFGDAISPVQTAHSQRPSITETALSADISSPQQSSHPTQTMASATPRAKEAARRGPSRTHSSGPRNPFSDLRDTGLDPGLESASHSDIDRTPRPAARLMPDNQRSVIQSSVSPVRRKTKEGHNGEALPSFTFPPDTERPPLIQVSQSHLPGFQVSRETSIDGDYSSTNGTSMVNRAVEPSDESRSRVALAGIESNDPLSRLKSKVLPKELWMRDESAKECFSCGEPFSTFRRKHHCRKLFYFDST